MAQIKLGVWNIEWMNDLFTGNPPQFKDNDVLVRGPQQLNTVAQRLADISGVINEIAADALIIVEGPNRIEEIQLFFDSNQVNGDWKCFVQPSGPQSVCLAARIDTNKFVNPPFVPFEVTTAEEALSLKAATDPFSMDTDGDGVDEVHKFERIPLYVELQLNNNKVFRVLGVHLKSKGVFGAYEWSKWWSQAEGNRKKLLAQCFRLRDKFLNAYLEDPQTKNIPLIVCGDINDGPGFDTSEMRLQASGVERLMGSIWEPDFSFGNALFDTLKPKERAMLDFSSLYTASFKDPIFDGVYQRVWIDHILYSRNKSGWINDAKVHVEMPDNTKIYEKYRHASDHFPVTCIVSLD